MFTEPEKKSHTLTMRHSFATGFGLIFGAMTAFAFWWLSFAVTVLILAQKAPHLLRALAAAKSVY